MRCHMWHPLDPKYHGRGARALANVPIKRIFPKSWWLAPRKDPSLHGAQGLGVAASLNGQMGRGKLR